MKALLRSMIQPDPTDRITAREANRHRALAVDVNTDMSTPPFVRTAASLPVEPKEKKQVPREKRDQKRSQALQAETGAKFVKNDNKRQTKQVDKVETELAAMTTPSLEASTKSAMTASAAKAKSEVVEHEMAPAVDQRRPADANQVDEINPALARASPGYSPLQAGPDPASELESQPDGDYQEVKKGQREVTAGKPNDSSERAPGLIAFTGTSAVRHVSPPHHAGRDLRRPASAAALRNIDRSPLQDAQNTIAGNGFDRTRYIQKQDQTSGGAGSAQHLRHTRIASEGAMRLLNNAIHSANTLSERPRPKSQMSFARVDDRGENRVPGALCRICRFTFAELDWSFPPIADEAAHIDAGGQWCMPMPIPQASQIQGESDPCFQRFG